MHPDLILIDGRVTTLDPAAPEVSALAIRDGVITATGADPEILALAGPETARIDLQGRRVLPGLIDNHTHVIRGGLNFNLELRWDGVDRSIDLRISRLRRKLAAAGAPPDLIRSVRGRGYLLTAPT